MQCAQIQKSQVSNLRNQVCDVLHLKIKRENEIFNVTEHKIEKSQKESKRAVPEQKL
jgi:hypothetical protein